MAEKRLDIILRARNMLEQGFAGARAEMQGFSQLADKVTKGFADKAAAGLAAAAAFEGALRTLDAVTKLLKGDMELALDTFERLPIVGGMINAVRELAKEWSGYNARLEEHNRVMAEASEWERQHEAAVAKRVHTLDALGSMLQGLAETRRIAEADMPEEALANIAFEQAASRIDELWKSLSAFQQEKNAAVFDELWGELEAQLARARKKVDEKRAEESQKQADREASLASQLRQKELAAEGAHLEARLEQVREFYRQKLATATGADREMFLRMQELDIAQARKAAQPEARAAYTGLAAMTLSSRFQGLTDRFRYERAIETLARQRNEKLDAIVSNLELQRAGVGPNTTGFTGGIPMQAVS